MKRLVTTFALGSICLTAAACSVQKTQEAKLPDVKVETTKGQLPHYNVQGPDVQVGEKTATVKVPTIKVTTPDHKG